MITVLVSHRVTNFEVWWHVYQSLDALRRKGGVRSHRVWRSRLEPNFVFVEHTFDSEQAANGYVETAELHDALRHAGVHEASLEVHYLDEIVSTTL